MTDEKIDSTQDEKEAEAEAEIEIHNQTIDDIFEGKPEEPEPKGAEETKEPEKSETEETKEKQEAEPPAAEGESAAFKKAYLDEKRKRQDAEKRAQELESKLPKSPEGKKVPDPIDDPQGYAQYMEDKSNLDALRVKVNLSRDIMLDAKEDYAEKEKVFVALAKTNPFLIQQMNASPNPAKFAYQTAVQHLETEQLRDPKYRENLEAEIRAKVLAELQQPEKGKKPDKKTALDVPDLTKATAAGKNSDKGEKVAELADVMEGSPF